MEEKGPYGKAEADLGALEAAADALARAAGAQRPLIVVASAASMVSFSRRDPAVMPQRHSVMP